VRVCGVRSGNATFDCVNVQIERHVTSLLVKYGVNYKRYWVDEKEGKIFCLVEAPDAETAHRVHREAHGLVADEIYEVQEGE
jgi:Nickel responsive protein SCO4226-like